MLEQILRIEYRPGSNPKVGVFGANWRFLLPELDPEAIVVAGAPTIPALQALAQTGARITVVTRGVRRSRRVRRDARRAGIAIEVAVAGPAMSVPLADASADVVAVLEDGVLDGGEVARLLRGKGAAFLEPGGRAGAWPGGSGIALKLSPERGEMRACLPAGEPMALAWMRGAGIWGQGTPRPALRRKAGVLVEVARGRARRIVGGGGRPGARAASAPPAGRRTGVLAHLGGDGAGPPRYVRDLAASAGIELAGRRWALAAGGEYASQKIAMFLFDGDEAEPDIVVKITRDSRFNDRLENEYHSLVALKDAEVGHPAAVPRPLFAGRHAGLAVIGETALAGVPFREATEATPQCPRARAAIDGLIGLATATGERAVARDAADGLRELHARFLGIYRPARRHADFLARQIDTVAASESGFPAVFLHGDPGTWNLLATPDGGVGLLDWEASEPHGMPLWDLFFFMRSYGVWVTRRVGGRDSMRSFAQHFLASSGIGSMLCDATRDYCARTGVPGSLVEPLFFTCWMHRALREAMLVEPSRLSDATYVRLLGRCIDEREAPGLRTLFAAGTPTSVETSP